MSNILRDWPRRFMSRCGLRWRGQVSPAIVIRAAASTPRSGAITRVMVVGSIQGRIAVSMAMSSRTNRDRVALDNAIVRKSGRIHAIIC
jgi:hypothetical protein